MWEALSVLRRDEKLKNLFKLLRTEMEERKERLISVGVSSFAAYRESRKEGSSADRAHH